MIEDKDPYQLIVETLYDLTRDELRYLALECLEISDGVDSPMRKRDDFNRRVQDLAMFGEPSWWQPVKHYRWKRHSVEDAVAALSTALIGEVEPIVQIAVDLEEATRKGRLHEGESTGYVE